MIVFKESPLVLASAESDARAVLAVARRHDLPIQLELTNPNLVPPAREIAVRDGVRAVFAGVLSSADGAAEQARAFVDAGADLLYVTHAGAIDVLGELARIVASPARPFAIRLTVREGGTMPDGTTLAEAIASLDRDPASRPWLYLLASVGLDDARAALETLFRAAPPLAHRVVGVEASASGSPEHFADDVRACAETFGLSVLGARGNANADYLDALASVMKSAGSL